jgi:hypothetical protein
VRSDVRVVPGPPLIAKLMTVTLLLSGAIAQLGERVLCKHEVVGSIPSGSTSRLFLARCDAWDQAYLVHGKPEFAHPVGVDAGMRRVV